MTNKTTIYATRLVCNDTFPHLIYRLILIINPVTEAELGSENCIIQLKTN